MSVKEWENGSLILDLQPDGNIERVVKKAFAEMRYVEAFSVLHSWIDYLMWEMQADEPRQFQSKFLKIRFNDSLRKIREKGLISKNEAGRLANFSERRDVVVHRIIFNTLARIDPGEDFPALRITMRGAKESFDDGLALAKMLDAKRRRLLAQPHNLRRRQIPSSSGAA